MNFKKHYINGHSSIQLKFNKKEFKLLPHMEWNNLMYKLTMLTTKPFVLDLQYDMTEYPYTPTKVERIESWYGREWIFGKKRQYTKSTFMKV